MDRLWPHESPFGYCSGNPVNWIDPDGRLKAVPFQGEGWYWQQSCCGYHSSYILWDLSADRRRVKSSGQYHGAIVQKVHWKLYSKRTGQIISQFDFIEMWEVVWSKGTLDYSILKGCNGSAEPLTRPYHDGFVQRLDFLDGVLVIDAKAYYYHAYPPGTFATFAPGQVRPSVGLCSTWHSNFQFDYPKVQAYQSLQVSWDCNCSANLNQCRRGALQRNPWPSFKIFEFKDCPCPAIEFPPDNCVIG